MRAMKTTGIAGLLVSMLFAGVSAVAQERKAYRHVDQAGNVTYSQTPPIVGKDATKTGKAEKVERVNIAPAQQGRGGYTGGYYHNDYPRHYSPQQYSSSAPSAAQQRQSAQEQRLAAVKAECERNRGADCNHPATLQYLDSTSIPGGRRR